jgi:hypothetical protein
MSAFVECPVCGMVGYPTTKAAMRKHYAPGDYPKPDRQFCPGSGKPGTPVERTR